MMMARAKVKIAASPWVKARVREKENTEKVERKEFTGSRKNLKLRKVGKSQIGKKKEDWQEEEEEDWKEDDWKSQWQEPESEKESGDFNQFTFAARSISGYAFDERDDDLSSGLNGIRFEICSVDFGGDVDDEDDMYLEQDVMLDPTVQHAIAEA